MFFLHRLFSGAVGETVLEPWWLIRCMGIRHAHQLGKNVVGLPCLWPNAWQQMRWHVRRLLPFVPFLHPVVHCGDVNEGSHPWLYPITFSSGTGTVDIYKMHSEIMHYDNSQKPMQQQLGPSTYDASLCATFIDSTFGGNTHEVLEATSCGTDCVDPRISQRWDGKICSKTNAANTVTVLGSAMHSSAWTSWTEVLDSTSSHADASHPRFSNYATYNHGRGGSSGIQSQDAGTLAHGSFCRISSSKGASVGESHPTYWESKSSIVSLSFPGHWPTMCKRAFERLPDHGGRTISRAEGPTGFNGRHGVMCFLHALPLWLVRCMQLIQIRENRGSPKGLKPCKLHQLSTLDSTQPKWAQEFQMRMLFWKGLIM